MNDIEHGRVKVADQDATRRLRWVAPVLLVLFVAAIIAINPVGFVGGGADDAEYLIAARCWVAAAEPCLAHTHWASRWPVVGPLALATGLFGESRASVGLAPLLYLAASLALMVRIGDRLFGRPSGMIAAAALMVTPAFAVQALDPAADAAEIAWQLAAFAAGLLAFDRNSRGWAAASGIALGIAAAARDTSLLMFPIAALAAVYFGRERRALWWLIPAMIVPMVIEAASYALVAGDPFWRFRLSLGHVGIPSAELPAGFDTSQSPLLNPDYIANWRRESEIHVFWPIDPWLNLVFGVRMGATLVAAMLLGLFYARRSLSPSAGRALLILSGGALFYSAMLVYGLAIDPKSRMFFVLAAAASFAIGAITVREWSGHGKLGVVVTLIALAAIGTLIIAISGQSYSSERAVIGWIKHYPRQIEVDVATRRYLALVRSVDPLPDRGSGKPLLIVKSPDRCSDFVRPDPGHPPKALIVEAHQMGGSARMSEASVSEMCLLRYTAAFRREVRP